MSKVVVSVAQSHWAMGKVRREYKNSIAKKKNNFKDYPEYTFGKNFKSYLI